MQRVSALLPSWGDRRKSNTSTSAKASIERLSSSSDKRPKPLQRLSTTSRIAREDFWPATLDHECDRSARILKSFCSDGYLAPLQDDNHSITSANSASSAEPQTPIQVFQKIPTRIIQNAAGIAIFTCMRSGLWMTGSGGSGILIARKADGTWSPPSGILLHTPILSFIMGVDIYDCVLVINNMAALESLITRPNVTLGEDIGLTRGPLVSLESTGDDMRWRDFDGTVLTYLKARGQAQTVDLSGCILRERGNENERFYGSEVTPLQILAGNVARQVEETLPLTEVLKAAEGRIDADLAIINQLSSQPAPGDAMIATPRDSPVSPTAAFGMPNAADPDPFGILALEMAGLEIREAGTRLRPGSRQFDYSPSPTSPAFSKFSRQSVQASVTESNRGSYMSTRTETTKMSDAHTQTDLGQTPSTTPTHSQSEDGRMQRLISGSHSIESCTMTDSATSTDEQSRTDGSTLDDAATKASSIYEKEEMESQMGNDEIDDDADDEDDESEDEEEPIIYEVASLQPTARTAMIASPIQVKGSLVTIPKRIPPPLPTRSPARASRASKSELGDVSHLASPLHSNFTTSPRQSYDAGCAGSEGREIPSILETPAVDEPAAATPSREQVDVAVEVDKSPLSTKTSQEFHEAKEDLSPQPAAPGAFPSDDEVDALFPPVRNPRRQSKPEKAAETQAVSPRPVSVA
ncbi:LAS seventeen-binding protein [Verticillium alfalfae VaMs.102]|uniref:LAS seventeen-binding protein n=1 Tax=Verticillium alfalfae (strain VaMs.102 / ATCC MYA-4576 / FGSC 10136) TaxID=526221 RepID=C9SJA3_VERA1|nr:LAS seventeen-binding protein [Verticillium alfalfae VaMs.102]EEY18265.1 LAS seventeen-binding protein [Verticillium alfalfae VaMs.102]